MALIIVVGHDAQGTPFRIRGGAPSVNALRVGLEREGVAVVSTRTVPLTRWPFVGQRWPILAWPLAGFFLVSSAAVVVRARRLQRGDEVLPVSPRAFDILAQLVQRAGQTVTKAELMERVWPDVFVEEANLAQHVSQLRRLLGDTTKQPAYIATIPRP